MNLNWDTILKGISAAACGIAGFLWGELDGLMLALIAFMTIDYLTGLIVGYKTRRLSSRTGFTGIARKGVILLVVAVAHILDTQLFGGESSVCRSTAIGFYLANEGISIMENTTNLGVPWPPALVRALQQIKQENDED